MPPPFTLSPAIRALLEGPNTAHLSSIRPDGSPASHPVWVGLDADDHVFLCTGRATAKVRNVEHDPRVALSVISYDNPYEEAMLRGVVIAVRNDDELVDMDVLSHLYTGRPFPSRSSDRVTIVIEPTWARHGDLPFTHTPGSTS